MSGAREIAIEAVGLYNIFRESAVETVALRGAALSLSRGTWVSVMGPSGSGKSTLVHVMAGLLEPSGGSVLLGGVDLTRLPAPERAQLRRQRIGSCCNATTSTRCWMSLPTSNCRYASMAATAWPASIARTSFSIE